MLPFWSSSVYSVISHWWYYPTIFFYCPKILLSDNGHEHKSVSMRVRTIFCCLVFLGHSSRLGVFPVDHLRKVSGPESFSTPTPPRYSFITPTAVFHEWQNKKPMIFLLPEIAQIHLIVAKLECYLLQLLGMLEGKGELNTMGSSTC